MRPDSAEIARYLCCPDDSAPLSAGSNSLHCAHCSRHFPFHAPRLLEILPSLTTEIPSFEAPAEYRNAYVQNYSQTCTTSDDALPFAAPESSSAKMLERRQRQTDEVLRLLLDPSGDSNGIFCDLSAGAGHTTFAAAQRSRLVFHCDLSAAAVRYVAAKAARLGVENIVAVRADYFRPPFRNCIDRLTCLDSLIRGPWHELKLLASIRQILAPGGVAVVDFHNLWHNPLRRLGLLRQNFGENRSYTRKEVLQLLRQAGIDQFSMAGFVQEVAPQRFAAKLLHRLIPATRLVLRFKTSVANK